MGRARTVHGLSMLRPAALVPSLPRNTAQIRSRSRIDLTAVCAMAAAAIPLLENASSKRNCALAISTTLTAEGKPLDPPWWLLGSLLQHLLVCCWGYLIPKEICCNTQAHRSRSRSALSQAGFGEACFVYFSPPSSALRWIPPMAGTATWTS